MKPKSKTETPEEIAVKTAAHEAAIAVDNATHEAKLAVLTKITAIASNAEATSEQLALVHPLSQAFVTLKGF